MVRPTADAYELVMVKQGKEHLYSCRSSKDEINADIEMLKSMRGIQYSYDRLELRRIKVFLEKEV